MRIVFVVLLFAGAVALLNFGLAVLADLLERPTHDDLIEIEEYANERH
jgi:hypothetical protein